MSAAEMANDVPSQTSPLVSPSDLLDPEAKVADVMTAGPRTCSPASTALEATLVMRDADCGVVPVIDVGKPVGVVTDRDIALALPTLDDTLGRTPVAALMTQNVVVIAPEASLAEAVETLGSQGVRRLLVVGPQGNLVGILSWSDLIPHLSEGCLGRTLSLIVEGR